LASDECVLLLVVHHIVVDAWSTGIFCRELSQIYNSLKNGKPSPLPPLSIQYTDFAVWQRGRLQDVTLENHISYWRKQLDGLSTLRLPITRLKLESDSSFSAREEFQFSEELLATLRKLNERTGTTLFMLLLAAYKVALQRYTGQTDIAVGTPTAGRNHPQVEELIGFFLNMLVLRTDLCGNPTFRELLERIRKVCVDALTHQDLPFETIVEELRPRRDLSQNPLIQVTFALQNTPKCPLNLMGVTARDLDISAGIARPLNLHLFMVEEVSGLRGYVSYNTSLFQADFIRRFISHLQNILMGIVANPDQRISDLPMLTEPEKHRLLVEWNDTGRDYPKDKCIHQLFEEQVERTPEAIAVVLEDQELTYGELNRRANQLARYLRKLGVGSEVLVGTCMERSLEMIVGLLGILKAGSAYVPLDPNYPVERLDFMLTDAHVSVLLTQSGLLKDGGSRIHDGDRRSSNLDRQMRRICLDVDWQMIARESDANPESITTADNLAYVTYTSGSTGSPKGVLIEHRGLCNVAEEQARHFCVNPSDRVLQFASSSFDASIFEVVLALTAGATLYLGTPETLLVGSALADFLRLHEITIATLPPSVLATLSPRELPALRSLCVAGEVCPSTLVGEWAVDRRFFNLYGPTEATIWATVAEYDGTNARVSIGRPIANTEIYILDAQRNPVPIGVAGEIYIGGVGLARGYLNQPELTAEKFIHHSFGGEPVRRLYRTGDLARYLADGNIEFLGRIDNQVKLRGYRIELGEVETVLGQHPMVQSSVVVVREDVAGDKRLVAYVVARPKKSFEVAEIRNYLKQKLPEYMIPSAFVLLDELPLTPNGKVDRDALPAPDQDRPELGNVYEAPRTPMEETLATIWSELLKVEKVGIQDNFFDLGGHSLLATQIVSRIRSTLSVEVPLRCLFESPTIEQMGAAIMEYGKTQSREQELENVSFELESLPDEDAQRVVAEETRSTSAGEPHE
jgi:amino acid adenylation domain-containing protein